MNHFSPLFLGHGSPMNAIESNMYSQFLANYAKSIPKPSAVIVISAHWETSGTVVTGNENPEQIYDFGGFPRELSSLAYSPQGSPELADRIAQEIPEIQVDPTRGIDHGAWAVVKNLFPKADVPLIQISLDRRGSAQFQFELGKKLAKFADENILIIGSGNMIHNLRDISWETNAVPFDWAIEMDRWFKEKLESSDLESLFNYKTVLPNFRRAVPTEEHLLPLFTILGMKRESQLIKTIFETIQNGSIAMRSIEIGNP